MTLANLKKTFQNELNSQIETQEIDAQFFLTIDVLFGFSKTHFLLNKDELISQEVKSKLLTVLKRLKTNEPIQYILGEVEFFGLHFKVNKNVLIPRPETEELVSIIIDDAKKSHQKSPLQILDIGTGSGCIAISLKKNLTNAQVDAIDVSKNALIQAKLNAELNKVPIHFIEKDILKTEVLDQKYDVIVSNPPYVRELEKKQMQPNVLLFEPESALFVSDENPLIFYSKITELAKNHLTKNGTLYFEINEFLADKMLQMVTHFGFNKAIISKDVFGKNRFLKAQF